MPLIIVLFFISGATALIYEVVWSKYLGLMFGSTIQAQTVVLAVFMGGLALGNTLLARRADLLKRPLVGYGILELLLGVYGFGFESIYQASDQLFILVGSPLISSTTLFLLWKGFLSILLLGIPTVLMGGTLPLLASWLAQNSEDPLRMSARFYSINTLGAVAGSALAGFYLIQSVGLPETLKFAAFLNVGVGLISMFLGYRMHTVPERFTKTSSTNDSTPIETEAWNPRYLSLLVMVVGGVSMGLEVLAARTLALVFGGSLQSFALVLIAFILGIGIGATLVSSKFFNRFRPSTVILVCLMGASLTLVFLLLTVEEWAILYSKLRNGLAPNGNGYLFDRLIVGFISILVLGLPAGLLGSILPMAIRLGGNSSKLGKRTGMLLTWNTAGAVVGVVLTGFVLMPTLGLPGSFALQAAVLSVLIFLLASKRGHPKFKLAAISLVIIAAVSAGFTGERWRNVLNSGVFRIRVEVTHEVLKERRSNRSIVYHKDAADASIAVEKATDKDETSLVVNGKADATAYGDRATQLLLAHLPFAMRPESKQAFVFGLGSGTTAGTLATHPLDQVTIAENCKPILEAARYFDQWNRGVLTNSKVRLFKEDARTVLKLDPRNYDIIVSEPSNPWVAGNASVFTEDFYKLAQKRLNMNGIMAQWFHIYEMNDLIVHTVLRTFNSVFPYIEIWEPQSGDMILLGSMEPWTSNSKTYGKIFERPEPRADLESIGISTPEILWARQVSSQENAFAISGPGPVQTDLHPFLEYYAPKAFFMGSTTDALANFDDRTTQSGSVSQEKFKTLQSIPMQSLIKSFSRYATANGDLSLNLQFFNNQDIMSNVAGFQPPLAIPCLFANGFGQNQGAIKLLAARNLLFEHPETWEKATEEIETLLKEAGAKASIWTRADRRNNLYFWSVAAHARRRNQGAEGSRKASELGHAIFGDDAQVKFFDRIAAGYARRLDSTPVKPKAR